MSNNKIVRMSLNMSPELSDKLEKMSDESFTTKTDILKKAIFLMDIAIESKRKGNKLAIVDSKGHKISEIIGI